MRSADVRSDALIRRNNVAAKDTLIATLDRARNPVSAVSPDGSLTAYLHGGGYGGLPTVYRRGLEGLNTAN